jgi:hypothetical protein
MYEARDDDAREMRRLAAAERRAGNSDRMDSKAAAKYAGSEAKSAEREDKKSKGKHIHGYAIGEARVDDGKTDDQKKSIRNQRSGMGGFDRTMVHIDNREEKKKRGEKEDSWWKTKFTKDKSGKVSKHRSWHVGNQDDKRARIEKEEFEIGESAVPGKPAEKLGAVSSIPKDEQDAARERTLAKAAAMRAKKGITKEELELELRAHLRERALDASETKEKESVYKAIKPSKLAKSYPEKSPKELKSLRYAISTNQAKKNMDTSRSDKRYGVEG